MPKIEKVGNNSINMITVKIVQIGCPIEGGIESKER